MRWVYDDGGRADAGFKGDTGDCAVRAIAIATGLPYREVYDRVNVLAADERPRSGRPRSNARTGVWPRLITRYLAELGWTWTPTMQVGSGCKVHLTDGELPEWKPLIARVSKHFTAVLPEGDHAVIHDTFDPSREGTRCVYGYWSEGR